MLARTRHAPREERRRLALFAGGLILGSVPLLLDVLLTQLVPAYAEYSSEPGRNRALVIVISAFILLIPGSTAYSVVVDHVFDVRFFVRRAIQYALARYTAFVGLALPVIVVGSLVWRNRNRPLGDLLADVPLGVWLGVFAAALVLLAVRGPMLDAIDRRFFREQYDARRIFLELVEGIRLAPSPHDLATLVVGELDRALHLECATLLIYDVSIGSFRDPRGFVRPLSRATTLAGLAGGASTPLEVNISLGDSALARLPEDERVWLADAGARVLVPLIGSDKELVGVLVIGEKLSELPFSQEDRMLLVTVAASAAFALESRLRSGSSGTGHGATPDQSVPVDEEPARQCVVCAWAHPGDATTCPRCGSCVLDRALLPPVLVGKFSLEQQVGSGGMGVVYRAVDRTLNRLVALKTLPRVSPERATRLRREARAMASVRHEHLAVIYGLEGWRGTPVLVLEYMERGTLADRLRVAPLDAGEVATLGTAMAEALHHVHGHGLLHRDVKPSNIGYTLDEVPKLLDFGLMRLAGSLAPVASVQTDTPPTEDSVDGVSTSDDRSVEMPSRKVQGTPPYLPPEAIVLRPPDVSWDLWALAVTLYEALTGSNPFMGANVSDTLDRVARAAPPDPRQLVPSCPAGLALFLLACLAANPRGRPRSALELEVGLQHALRV